MSKKILLSFLFLHSLFSWGQFRYRKPNKSKGKIAIAEKLDTVMSVFKKHHIKKEDFEVLFVIYKDENKLVVFGKNWYDLYYQKLLSYEICFQSGQLGPKKRGDDYQIPEGFYQVESLNPRSDYYISLGINYPNLADKRKNKTCDLYANIAIQGGCFSVGSISMTDDIIKTIYILALVTRQNGFRIPIFIFPFKMTKQNMLKHADLYQDNNELLKFWINLMLGYQKFAKTQGEIKYFISKKGDYVFKP